MKNTISAIVMMALVALCAQPLAAASRDTTTVKRKVITGIDGGVFLNTGYVSSTVPGIGLSGENVKISGAPFGIGGFGRLSFWDHWRLGGEGHMSDLSVFNNGSKVKNCYGGAMFDYYYGIGKWKPYCGIMIGFGWSEFYLLFSEDDPRGPSWEPVDKAYFNQKWYFALAPYIGCEYKIIKNVSAAVRFDYVCGPGSDPTIPFGPRFYFGLVFTN